MAERAQSPFGTLIPPFYSNPLKNPNDNPAERHIQIATKGGEAVALAYTIRRSERAKHMRLRVLRDGRVEVVLPARAPSSRVETFVRDNTEWIHRTRARMMARTPDMPASTTHETWYKGRRVPVTHLPGNGSSYLIHWTGKGFEITGDGSQERTAELLEAWFRKAARAVFHERAHALNAGTRYSWSRIRIGDQATRWGSCSTNGTLSFNWRLLMAPPEVLDYVVIHELAHLREMNHSPRFWALVQAQCPGFQRHIEWLKDHGATLR